MRRLFTSICLAAILLPARPVAAQINNSAYLFLGSDRLVATTSEALLVDTILNLTNSGNVLFNSDGRYYPFGSNAAGYVFIRVDGVIVSNTSTIDWRTSLAQEQHSYNAVGAKFLSAGAHHVELVAGRISGSFYVGALSNLSAFVSPATQVFNNRLPSDTAVFNFITHTFDGMDTWDGIPPLPHTPLVSRSINSSGSDIIALASGRAYKSGTSGDAMLGIYFDGNYIGYNGQVNTKTQWSVNDLCTCAEVQAPFFAHAFFGAPSATSHTISLDATEFPWYGQGNFGCGSEEDCVQYKVGADTTLVTLAGGMSVRGGAAIQGASGEAISIAPVNQDFKLIEKVINVPPLHHGNVMFMARARIQANIGDQNALVSLFMTVDGIARGSRGVQSLVASPGSQRTLTASYLASGALKLTQGNHTVRVFVRAEGSIPAGPYVYLDMPLIWFD